jgi:formate dehydrogenase major subunit
MTNHWRDIRNADLIMINGGNPAEAHPVGFRWFMKAKVERGAKMIHVDPRFTRTSAVSDIHLRIRTGTDAAYFGGLINYVLQNNLFHEEYVREYTNAAFVVDKGYSFKDGMFNGFDPETGSYDATTWKYETAPVGSTRRKQSPGGLGRLAKAATGLSVESAGPNTTFARIDIDHPRSVMNLMRKHYARYTPEMVERITGIPRDQFLEVAKLVGEMGRPDKVMTQVYAVGLTHHTTGSQMIRAGAVLQLLLGNIGRPGGGMNAERGHANIQGNTDNAISWEVLPGYLKVPAPGQRTVADYVEASASKKAHPNALNFFGENYGKFLVSTLKAWYGDKATKRNEFAFDYLPKPAGNASWISIFDQALQGKMEGLMLSGMTASSIGPDSNQVQEALGKLKWLCVMDSLPTTSSEFWHAPGVDSSKVNTEVFVLPATHWIEKDGSFTNSGRWLQWKDAVLPPEHESRHDHWMLADLFLRVRELYRREGGKFPGPVMDLTSGEARAGRDRQGGQRQGPEVWQAARDVPRSRRRRQHVGGQLDLHRLVSRERQPDAAPQRRAGPEEQRSHGHGLLPGVGVVLAGEPPRALQPRLGRPRRQAVGPEPAGHPVGRQAEAVGRRRARLLARRGPARPGIPTSFHHDRRGHRPPVLERARGRPVP